MIGWQEFELAAPDIAGAGRRLLAQREVAFLATVSSGGRPRLHPFVPRIVDGALLAFVMASSPKFEDLTRCGYHAIHALPGEQDEEFFAGGAACYRDSEADLRERAAAAMGFATGVDDQHVLFEFEFDRALWTRWLDFGTPRHRPQYRKWIGSVTT